MKILVLRYQLHTFTPSKFSHHLIPLGSHYRVPVFIVSTFISNCSHSFFKSGIFSSNRHHFFFISFPFNSPFFFFRPLLRKFTFKSKFWRSFVYNLYRKRLIIWKKTSTRVLTLAETPGNTEEYTGSTLFRLGAPSTRKMLSDWSGSRGGSGR